VTPRLRPSFLVLGAWLALPVAAVGQSADSPPRKQAVAVMVPPGSVRIDGRMNEEIWTRAPAITDFVQSEPEEGAPPTDAMEVRFLYDDDALFVGARMHTRNPAGIQAPMSRRDEGTGQAEHIFVSLDTYLDRRTAYTFGVTAAGVRFDHYHPNDNRGRPDREFDPVWEARTTIDGEGWVAEMRIPFHQLRFTAGDAQVWGLNVYRRVPSRNEEVYWSLVRRTERVWASRFGELRGIAGTRPTKRIEILPYVASSSTMTGSPAADNPFDDGRTLDGRVGGDLKMGLGPNLTLEATINPDFGQVEADPAEVNLTAFETFFDERRPFFVEGSRLLGAGGSTQPWEQGGAAYFYSRRIGARPVGAASGDFVDYPATSTILGAGKLSGRLASGTSVALLSAVTTEEFARTFDRRLALTDRQRVAPWTVFGVGRIQQEFGPAGSTAAFMLTTSHRDVGRGDPLAALATRDALTASGDALLRFREGEYELGMNIGFSRVSGDAPAIGRLQRASARYFQRPDAGHVEFDPSRASMAGMKGGVSAERTSGRHWLWRTETEIVSPEFEINDIGRLSTADSIVASGEIEYRETQPGRRFRNYSIAVEHEREWDFGGLLHAASIESEADVTWPNFWSTAFNVGVDLPAQDGRLTRGGPRMGTPAGWSVGTRVSNSFAANNRIFFRSEYRENEDGGLAFETNLGLTLRPTARWQLSLQPSFERRIDDQQYVAAIDGGPLATFGRRYVFAYVDRTTISSEIRLNYAFKPDVTLEFYGEPFAASGRYYDIGELVAAGARARRVYGVDGVRRQADSLLVVDGASQFALRNRDFNVLSFRSNLVLRWEWRPGSLLYVVWQQDRSESEVIGSRIGLRDVFGSFGAAGSNVLAIKTTFWLGVR